MDRLINGINIPPTWTIASALVLLILIWTTAWGKKRTNPQQPTHSPKESNISAYYTITPFQNFTLSTQQPLKLRPFKPKYHMTMALQSLPFSALLPFDNTYTERLRQRRSLLRDHRYEILACNPCAAPAVLELYAYLTRCWLPGRYPDIFRLECDGGSSNGGGGGDEQDARAGYLQNEVTGARMVLDLGFDGHGDEDANTHDPNKTTEKAKRALESLNANIDSDFFFLLPSDAVSASPQSKLKSKLQSPQSQYTLQSHLCAFPSHFSPRSKLGLSLSAIHAPVPHYADKLERSMERFFAGLEVGRCVGRVNWSVGLEGMAGLFRTGREGGIKEKEAKQKDEDEDEVEDEKQKDTVKINPTQTVLRCERQTLHRLPKTKAIVFAFKPPL